MNRTDCLSGRSWAFARASVFTVVAMTATFGVAGAQRSVADTLRDLERARVAALVAADSATLARITADDFQLVNPNGLTFTKSQYIRSIIARDVHYIKWEILGDIAVRSYGNAAALRYAADHDNIINGGDTSLSRNWHTDIYERRGEAWQIVWSQSSVVNCRASGLGVCDPRPPRNAVRLSPEDLRVLAGEYRAPGMQVRVAVTDSRLTLTGLPQGSADFWPLSSTRFFLPGSPIVLVFVRNADGTVKAFDASTPNGNLHFDRSPH